MAAFRSFEFQNRAAKRHSGCRLLRASTKSGRLCAFQPGTHGITSSVVWRPWLLRRGGSRAELVGRHPSTRPRTAPVLPDTLKQGLLVWAPIARKDSTCVSSQHLPVWADDLSLLACAPAVQLLPIATQQTAVALHSAVVKRAISPNYDPSKALQRSNGSAKYTGQVWQRSKCGSSTGNVYFGASRYPSPTQQLSSTPFTRISRMVPTTAPPSLRSRANACMGQHFLPSRCLGAFHQNMFS